MEVRVGVLKHWAERTRGPQALSSIRRDWAGEEGAGMRGAVRARRWLASWMLQPPVRWLYVFAKVELKRVVFMEEQMHLERDFMCAVCSSWEWGWG